MSRVIAMRLAEMFGLHTRPFYGRSTLYKANRWTETLSILLTYIVIDQTDSQFHHIKETPNGQGKTAEPAHS